MELVSSEAVRQKLFYVSPLAAGGLLAIFVIPWLVEGSPQSLFFAEYSLCAFPVSKFPLFEFF